jgi:hypothetical protein
MAEHLHVRLSAGDIIGQLARGAGMSLGGVMFFRFAFHVTLELKLSEGETALKATSAKRTSTILLVTVPPR